MALLQEFEMMGNTPSLRILTMRAAKGPKDHMNIRNPQNMISGIHLLLGPQNSNVGSLRLCGLLVLPNSQ